MNDPTTDVAAKIRDIHLIYNLVGDGHGLPMPITGPDRSSFWFVHIVHAEDARNAVADAKRLFAGTLGAVFAHHDIWTENGARRMYEALLPSGLTIVLTARAEHMQDEGAAADAAELVAA